MSSKRMGTGDGKKLAGLNKGKEGGKDYQLMDHGELNTKS
jgi:hypothetical protein